MVLAVELFRPLTKDSRFKQPPLVPISGLGFGAIAKAEIDDDGNLIDIVIMSPGTGYAASNLNFVESYLL